MIPGLVLLLLIPTGLVRAATDVEQWLRTMRESPNVETVRSLLPKIDAVLRDEESAFEALPAVERAAEILLPSAVQTGEWPGTASLLKTAARLRMEQAEPDKAANHLQSLQSLYRSVAEHSPSGITATQRARWSMEVALLYLRAEQTKTALDVLGEVVDHPGQPLPAFDELRAAVAGALHRRLEQARTDERYELLLAWSMPAPGRQTVRVFSSLASVEAPPDVFSRALGERPRANAFTIPAVNGVNGLFTTAWLLVRAASESGRLRRLTTDLEELAKANVPNADHLLLLARIVNESTNVNDVNELIDKHLGTLGQDATPAQPQPQRPNTPADTPAAADDLRWAVVGAACLQPAELRPTGQRVFETLLASLRDQSSPYARAFLQRARAMAVLQQHAGVDPQLLADPNLKFWIPASEENAARSATGAVRETWLSHEDHILHLAGPHNDYLCFRYPLTGDFEFQVEAQNRGQEQTYGNLAFGGLAYGIAGYDDEFRVWGLDMHDVLTRPFPFVRKESWPTYQRLTLRASDKGVQYVVNGHPLWMDPVTQSTSPWLALRCFGGQIPAFRNFRLTGDPVIPREVRISHGNLLRGWFTQFYPSHVSTAVPLGEEAVAVVPPASTSSSLLDASAPYDWQLRDGVIYGKQRGELLRAAVPSRLTYWRPIQNGESVDYEYWYEPDRHDVHPALGRLAFLIEPNGVRVHWLTSGEHEWTGLAENNATLEPLNRRGPRPLPLKPNDWNQVTMSLHDDTLTLTLNDVEIYSRKMEPDNTRRFSFYHDRSRSAVQVRNVILRGDWPEHLTDEDKQNLLASRQASP